MMINSLIAVSGIATFGLGNTTVKYISQFEAQGDKEEVLNVIRTTGTLYTLLGSGVALLVFTIAPAIANLVFNIDPNQKILLVLSIRISCVALLLRFMYGVVEAIAQGYHRYDFGAQITTVVTGFSILGACLIAKFNGGLPQIILAQSAFLLLGLICLCFRISHYLSHWKWLTPCLNLQTLAKVGAYAFWCWLQMLGNLLATQADKLIVGSLLGPAKLTYYTICMQILNVGYGFIHKVLSFIFPMSSKLLGNNEIDKLQQLFKDGMSMALSISCGFCIPLFLYPELLLTLWLGPEISAQTSPILPILAFSFALLSSSTVPFFYLNGTGYAKINAVSALGSGIFIAVGSIILIPAFGIFGAACSRLCNLPISFVNRTILQRKVFHNRNPLAGFIGFDVVLLLFTVCYLIRKMLPEFNPATRSDALPYLILLALIGVFSFCIVFFISKIMMNIYFKYRVNPYRHNI